MVTLADHSDVIAPALIIDKARAVWDHVVIKLTINNQLPFVNVMQTVLVKVNLLWTENYILWNRSPVG